MREYTIETKKGYIEVAVDEIVKINGRHVIAINGRMDCSQCFFYEHDSTICDHVLCNGRERKDKITIHFEEVEVKPGDNKMKELSIGEVFKVNGNCFAIKSGGSVLYLSDQVNITKIEIKRYDIPIGGIIEFGKELYEAMDSDPDSCEYCDLYKDCTHFACTPHNRHDGKSIIFKRINKK